MSPTSSFSVVIEGQPPSANHQYAPAKRRSKAGREYLGLRKLKDIETYQLIAVSRTRRARPAGWAPPPYRPKDGMGFITLSFSFYLGGEADTDNLMKILDDAVAIALGVNDRTFLSRAMHKQTGVKQPRVEIEISCDA